MSTRPAGTSAAPAPLSGAVTGLPVELTTFVGREREIRELRALLARSRLLTLTGAGGSGKSRLALEAVGPAAAELGLPVAWVELAALENEALLPRHVADACGLREEVRGGDPGVLAGLLRGRPLLLVLDNCEHLVDACAALADTLLRACPDLRIVATSREALGIGGERAWLVPALGLPAEDARDARSAAKAEAVRLFCERARDAVASWELTDENAGAVAEICRRLDGVPLALELAAARVRVLSPEDIRARLDDAFRLLGPGSRTSLPRHRTLRATMDWSHDLLREEGKTLLRRLAVFRGGFSMDAAEAVGAGGGMDAEEVLEHLARLVDRSMVGVRDQDGRARYVLLETVRQYAGEKLIASGEAAAVRERHARWVARRVMEAEPHLTRQERREWVDRLGADLDNIREALGWTREHAPRLHVDVVGRLWWFWFSTQHWPEAHRWIDGALGLPEASEPDLVRARLLFARGALEALRGGGEEARPALEEAALLAARAGDGRLEAFALNYLGMTWAGRRDPRGREPLERAAAWFEAHDDLYGLRLALLLLGTSAIAEGDLDRAEAMNARGVDMARRFGLERELAISLQNLAVVHLQRGEVDRAEPAVREALAASRRDPSWFSMAIGLQYMAEILAHRGDVLAAARVLGTAEAAREVIGARPFEVDRVRLEQMLPALRAAAGERAFDEARRQGRSMTPLQAIDEVLERAGSGPTAGEAGAGEGGGGPGTEGSPGAERGAAPALRVRALGGFHVEVEGRPVSPEAWRYVKPRELLVLLLLYPRGRTREQVAAALWPDAAPARAANSFHVTVHHLRKALGRPEWVERDADRYRLSARAEAWFDAEVFEREVKRATAPGTERVYAPGPESAPASGAGRDDAREVDRTSALEAALALYRGDLLEGEAVASWLEDHRDRLRALYVDAVIGLGEELEARDAWDAAADLYAAAIPREDLNEELHRRLMVCWARAGQRARALKHYDRVEALLRESVGAEPEAATRKLAERLRAG